MDSVIQGLENLSGYLKSRNLVVPMHFPWVPPERTQRGYIPRPIEAFRPVVRRQIAAATANSAPGNGITPVSDSENRALQVQPEKGQVHEVNGRQAIFD
jgi:hypothetical protein